MVEQRCRGQPVRGGKASVRDGLEVADQGLEARKVELRVADNTTSMEDDGHDEPALLPEGDEAAVDGLSRDRAALTGQETGVFPVRAAGRNVSMMQEQRSWATTPPGWKPTQAGELCAP